MTLENDEFMEFDFGPSMNFWNLRKLKSSFHCFDHLSYPLWYEVSCLPIEYTRAGHQDIRSLSCCREYEQSLAFSTQDYTNLNYTHLSFDS